jgi:hypothetical protein
MYTRKSVTLGWEATVPIGPQGNTPRRRQGQTGDADGPEGAGWGGAVGGGGVASDDE